MTQILNVLRKKQKLVHWAFRSCLCLHNIVMLQSSGNCAVIWASSATKLCLIMKHGTKALVSVTDVVTRQIFTTTRRKSRNFWVRGTRILDQQVFSFPDYWFWKPFNKEVVLVMNEGLGGSTWLKGKRKGSARKTVREKFKICFSRQHVFWAAGFIPALWFISGVYQLMARGFRKGRRLIRN